MMEPGRDRHELADLVDRRLDEVEQRLMAEVGGQSMCDLSRRGAPRGAKDLEGRQAALAALRRSLRRSRDDAATLLTRDLEDWRSKLDLDRDRGGAWLAYRNGGVDELEALREAWVV